ncbi:MAG: hypothetical protein ACOCYZ_04980 [Halococcoides sp.]
MQREPLVRAAAGTDPGEPPGGQVLASVGPAERNHSRSLFERLPG